MTLQQEQRLRDAVREWRSLSRTWHAAHRADEALAEFNGTMQVFAKPDGSPGHRSWPQVNATRELLAKLAQAQDAAIKLLFDLFPE